MEPILPEDEAPENGWAMLTAPGLRRKLAVMAGLGFASGLPLALSGFTLQQWLAEGGASLALIGLTANIGLPYTLKFLWSPVLDAIRPLPGYGRRRGWLLVVQPLLAAAILGLALSGGGVVAVAAAVVVAFLSATQDIAIDAWRIEVFGPRLQGAALAAYVWGYRAAMLVSGAGVLAMVGRVGWPTALTAMAVLIALAVAVTLAAPEPPPPAMGSGAQGRPGVFAGGREALADLLTRPRAMLILPYVALFYLGEAMAGVMLAPFYRHLGFDRAAVALATGPFSLAATLAGLALGGAVLARAGLARALIATGFAQMATMALYIWLSLAPGVRPLLYFVVTTEALAQGVASAAFLAYLSSLCVPRFAATQYAALSSLAPLAARTLGGLSGFLVQAVGWTTFYALAMAASLPAMALMLAMLRGDGLRRRGGAPVP